MPGLPRLRDGLPVGCGVRQAGGVCSCADSDGVSAAVSFASGTKFCLPVVAAAARPDRLLCAVAAALPEVRLADFGSKDRRSEDAWTGGARGVAAAGG